MSTHLFLSFALMSLFAVVSSQYDAGFQTMSSHSGFVSTDTISLFARDKSSNLDVVMDFTGYFQAKYSGLHKFSLQASSEASFQFGAGNQCTNIVDNSINDTLAIRTSSNTKPYQVLLEADLYYPMKIVHITRFGEPSFLDFQFKEPHHDYNGDFHDRIFQVDFGHRHAMTPMNTRPEADLLPGCFSNNSPSPGVETTIRSMGGDGSFDLSDEFFLEDYKMKDPWSKPIRITDFRKVLARKSAPENLMADDKEETNVPDNFVPVWYFKESPRFHEKTQHFVNGRAAAGTYQPVGKPISQESEPLEYSDPKYAYTIFDESEEDRLARIKSDMVSADTAGLQEEVEVTNKNLDFTGLEEFLPSHRPILLDAGLKGVERGPEYDNWDAESSDGQDVVVSDSEDDMEINSTLFKTLSSENSDSELFNDFDANRGDQRSDELQADQPYETPDIPMAHISEPSQSSSKISNFEKGSAEEDEMMSDEPEESRSAEIPGNTMWSNTTSGEVAFAYGNEALTDSKIGLEVSDDSSQGPLLSLPVDQKTDSLNIEEVFDRNKTGPVSLLSRIGQQNGNVTINSASLDSVKSFLPSQSTEMITGSGLLIPSLTSSSSAAVKIFDNKKGGYSSLPDIQKGGASSGNVSAKITSVAPVKIVPVHKAPAKHEYATDTEVKQTIKKGIFSSVLTFTSNELPTSVATTADHSLALSDRISTQVSSALAAESSTVRIYLKYTEARCVDSKLIFETNSSGIGKSDSTSFADFLTTTVVPSSSLERDFNMSINVYNSVDSGNSSDDIKDSKHGSLTSELAFPKNGGSVEINLAHSSRIPEVQESRLIFENSSSRGGLHFFIVAIYICGLV